MTASSTAQTPTPPSRPGLVSRLIRFGGLQVANAVAPLLVLPFVIRIIGPEGWVGLANGLGLGAAAAVAVGLAWPLLGPPRVAAASEEASRATLLESLVMRTVAFVPIAAVTALAAALLTPEGTSPVLPIAMALATALNGMSSNWYFIGRAQAGGVVLYDSVPKLAATALTIPAILLTDSALMYPILLGTAALGGVLASTWRVTRWAGLGAAVGPAVRALPSQIPLGAAGLLSSASTALAVPVATLAAIGVGPVAVFAAAVRLRSMAQAGIGAGTSALQGWVAERGPDVLRRRAPKAVLVNGTLGLVTGLGVFLLTPLVDHLIFGPDIEIDPLTAGLLGAVCLVYSVNASLTHHVLAPLGRSRTIVVTTSIASIVSVPAIFLMAQAFGAHGAMTGLLVSEGTVMVLQAALAFRLLRAR